MFSNKFISFLVGVTITLAIIELITRNLVSGTVRLFYGITISAIIGFGLDIGTTLYALAASTPKDQVIRDTACSPDRGIDPRWYPLFFLITSLSFNLLLNTHWRQLMPMTIIAALCYVTSYFTYPILDQNLSSIASAFVVGMCANLYAQWSTNPAILYVLSGLLMLVPGSMAVSGFFQFFQNDAASGVGLAITVLVVCSMLIYLFDD
jgi:uncharacterized membrane protein YjjB (DUF3815 family)